MAPLPPLSPLPRAVVDPLVSLHLLVALPLLAGPGRLCLSDPTGVGLRRRYCCVACKEEEPTVISNAPAGSTFTLIVGAFALVLMIQFLLLKQRFLSQRAIQLLPYGVMVESNSAFSGKFLVLLALLVGLVIAFKLVVLAFQDAFDTALTRCEATDAGTIAQCSIPAGGVDVAFEMLWEGSDPSSESTLRIGLETFLFLAIFLEPIIGIFYARYNLYQDISMKELFAIKVRQDCSNVWCIKKLKDSIAGEDEFQKGDSMIDPKFADEVSSMWWWQVRNSALNDICRRLHDGPEGGGRAKTALGSATA